MWDSGAQDGNDDDDDGVAVAVHIVEQAEQDGVAFVVGASGHEQAGPAGQHAAEAKQEDDAHDGDGADGRAQPQLPAASNK